MSQRRKKKTLLSNQKPKKRLSFSFQPSKRLILSGLALGAVLGLGYFGYQTLVKSSWLELNERPRLEAIRGLSEAEQAAISKSYRELADVQPERLERFSRQAYSRLGLRSIQLIQTSPDRLAIATEAFVPKMIVELDKLRFVTEDGIVFGSLGEQTVPLPVLRGLYRSAPFVNRENDSYVLSPANQKIVEGALLAIQEGARYNIQYRSLTFDEFRGLSAEMLDPGYRITLGFEPYDGKYKKLEKIIKSLRDRGMISATIELDYKGKAFIKDTTVL